MRRFRLAAAAVAALALLLPAAAPPTPPTTRRPAAAAAPDHRSSCSCSGSSRPSSPATSPPSTRASTRSRVSTSSSSRAASTSCRRPCSPRARPTTRSPGCPRRSPRASRARRSPTSGRSSPRSGTYQVAFAGQRHHGAGRPQGQEGRQLGLRQRVRAVRRHDQGRPRPGQGRHAGAAAVRHAGAAAQRHRRRPGDELQRVRPAAGGQEPGHRQALHSRTTSRSSTGTTVGTVDAAGRGVGQHRQAATTRRTRSRRSSSCTGTIKGWAYCRDNAEECRDLVVAKGSKLGTSHQLWQMNEVNKLIWPSHRRASAWSTRRPGSRPSTCRMTTKNQDGETVLTKQPEGLAYTNEYVQQAIDQAKAAGVDVNGAGVPAPDGHPERRRRLDLGGAGAPVPAPLRGS